MNARIAITGDSNALGFRNDGPAPYSVTMRVQMWTAQTDGSYAWEAMRPGVNTGTRNNPNAWGAEVQAANDWLADNDGGFLWIVKVAKGGTTLAVDWDPDDGAYFDLTADTMRAARQSLDGTPFAFDRYDAALVVLGENDATNPEFAAAYASNLAEFSPAARAAWGVETLVMSRITEHFGDAASNLAIRRAQFGADQADPDMISFKTIGFGVFSDGHYDAAGQLAIGARFYDAWLTD